ncbi:hypothetical protein DERP_013974, partial [Dermatophagoides pteronyssinus]
MTNPLITVDWLMLLITKNPGSRPATTTTTTTKRYLQTMDSTIHKQKKMISYFEKKFVTFMQKLNENKRLHARERKSKFRFRFVGFGCCSP